MIGASRQSFTTSGVRSLNSSMSQLKSTFAQLASGLRINRASDDAAGLAVASGIQVSAQMDRQASRNVGDALSALSIADDAMNQVTDLTTRRAELAMQSANGTYSDDQRKLMSNEYNQLGQEIDRLTASTEFNGTELLMGGELSVQVGQDGRGNSSFTVVRPDIKAAFSASSTLDITTQSGAQAALAATQTFAETITTARAEIGAAQSRLDAMSETLAVSREVKTEAASRIRDADIAALAASSVAQNTLVQASTAVLAQANQTGATVLKLLAG